MLHVQEVPLVTSAELLGLVVDLDGGEGKVVLLDWAGRQVVAQQEGVLVGISEAHVDGLPVLVEIKCVLKVLVGDVLLAAAARKGLVVRASPIKEIDDGSLQFFHLICLLIFFFDL